MEEKTLGISFGIMAEDLTIQLAKQGFTDEKVKYHERMRHAIHELGFGGYLSDSEIDKKFQKLMKDIKKNLVLIKEE